MPTKLCEVCDAETHPLARLCKRCKRFVDRIDIRRKPNKQSRIEALRGAWDGEWFQCYYTGVRLEENDFKHPRYLTFDHKTPRDEDDVVIAAMCINDMKTDLSEDEFRAVVLGLARKFEGVMCRNSIVA